MRRGGVKSFVDDLVLGRGVVISRAATSLRSVETQPLTRRFVRSRRATSSGNSQSEKQSHNGLAAQSTGIFSPFFLQLFFFSKFFFLELWLVLIGRRFATYPGLNIHSI